MKKKFSWKHSQKTTDDSTKYKAVCRQTKKVFEADDACTILDFIEQYEKEYTQFLSFMAVAGFSTRAGVVP